MNIFPSRDVLHRTANGPAPALRRQILSFTIFSSSSATAENTRRPRTSGAGGEGFICSTFQSFQQEVAFRKAPSASQTTGAHVLCSPSLASRFKRAHFARHCTTRRGSALAITTDVPTSALLPVLVSSSESPLAGKSSLFSCVFVAL